MPRRRRRSPAGKFVTFTLCTLGPNRRIAGSLPDLPGRNDLVVDIVDQLDPSALTAQYRGSGSAAHHPTVMLGLLIYGYATGVYSSRRIEEATHESIAFRYIAANEQSDHDSLCTFRNQERIA